MRRVCGYCRLSGQVAQNWTKWNTGISDRGGETRHGLIDWLGRFKPLRGQNIDLENERGPRLGTRAPKDAFRFPIFFFVDRGVGSSILASLSEAGGNDQHSSWSKPLPPRSRTCESRLSECVHVRIAMHAADQSRGHLPSRDFLIFVEHL